VRYFQNFDCFCSQTASASGDGPYRGLSPGPHWGLLFSDTLGYSPQMKIPSAAIRPPAAEDLRINGIWFGLPPQNSITDFRLFRCICHKYLNTLRKVKVAYAKTAIVIKMKA